MTRSMTAFARAEYGAAVWEIRSVNHRYLDVSFRMHDNMKHLETNLREALKGDIHRGKLECVLRIKSEAMTSAFAINEPLLAALREAMDKVSQISGISDQGDLLSLMRWPDVLTTEDDTEYLAADVLTGFQQAVDELVAMRLREGNELAEVIESKLVDTETTVALLRRSAPKIIEVLQDRLKKKLADLV